MTKKKCVNGFNVSINFATRRVFVLMVASLQIVTSQRCFHKARPLSEPLSCDRASRYRTISGRCNNLEHPEWGSAGSTMLRLLPNAYEDGRDIPRGGRHPSSLPNPRFISQKNHPDNDVPDSRFTHMVMQFGQFLDHDLTLTPKDEEINCCQDRFGDSDCFTISIPKPDRFYSWVNSTATCLNFVRSTKVCRLNTREQFNELTAFIDASNVYGSDQEHAAILRTYRDGKMQRNSNTDQLPTREQLNLRPNTGRQRPERPDDFMAGDMRVNEHPFLATLHVVFVREHNRIAKLLKEFLPSNYQTDEILYQETRRLVGAEMQNIVYGEYLPTVLGVDFMKKYGLIVAENTTYEPTINPTIFNSFATSAFRFGHSMINGMFKLVSQRRRSSKQNKDVYWLWRLREVFDGQSIRGARLPLENMVEGLVTQEPQTCDPFFSTEITDHLFQKNHRRENFGEDLLALNIQRGREHGLQPYNRYRQLCGLPQARNWNDRPEEIEKSFWKKFENVYDSVNDIDLYIGAISETPVPGGVVGPTFACLIGDQFSRLKKGDRFFYTHTNFNGGRGLGEVARKEVLKRTLGDVLCGVTQMGRVQKWVTLQPNSDYNGHENCFNKRELDIRAIAREITRELNDFYSTSNRISGNASGRRLFNGGPTTRNNLLKSGGSIGIKQSVVTSRIRDDFSFPAEVRRSGSSSSRRGPPGGREQFRSSHRGRSLKRERNSESISVSEQVLLNRLNGKPRFGFPATRAYLNSVPTKKI